MGRKILKSFLLVGALALLVPVLALAQTTPTPSPCANCKAIPEGGSTGEYLAGVGAICLGGLFLRTRLRKNHVT